MNASTIELSAFDLCVASFLVLLTGGVSVLLRLGLEKRLAIAALRTVVQLLLVGYILRFVFSWNQAWMVLSAALVMVLLAARAALQRVSHHYATAMNDTFISLCLSSLCTAFVVTFAIIGVRPWYQPQYFLPLLGMILGNSLTGVSLCLDSFLSHLAEKYPLIEMELAHGATRWEAGRDAVREAVRRGMIPIINAMTVVGIVSLPGMMTGQILAGNPPFQAVKYQIVVMFMIAAATALTCIGGVLLAYYRLFDKQHRLRRERLTNRSG